MGAKKNSPKHVNGRYTLKSSSDFNQIWYSDRGAQFPQKIKNGGKKFL